MAEPRGYVIGVYTHKKGGWRIVYVEDGVQKTKYRKSEATAQKFAADKQIELLGGVPRDDAPAPVTPEKAATSGDQWVRVLWALTGKAVQAPHDRDAQALLRAVSGAANAAAKFIDDAEVRDQITELEARMKAVESGRAAGRTEELAGEDQARAAVTPAPLLQ